MYLKGTSGAANALQDRRPQLRTDQRADAVQGTVGRLPSPVTSGRSGS
jgi:hypothetical protein